MTSPAGYDKQYNVDRVCVSKHKLTRVSLQAKEPVIICGQGVSGGGGNFDGQGVSYEKKLRRPEWLSNDGQGVSYEKKN